MIERDCTNFVLSFYVNELYGVWETVFVDWKIRLYSEFVFCGRALKLYGLFGLIPVCEVLFRLLEFLGVGLVPQEKLLLLKLFNCCELFRFQLSFR